jgi:hypothetical protein
MKKTALLLLCLMLMPFRAHAQGAAPEMFGVNEIVIENARFDDPSASGSCGLSRDDVAVVLNKIFAGSGVPVVGVIDARPIAAGVARIELIPEISSYMDESLGCVSWLSLSAESHSRVTIPPVNTLRTETIVYWRQHVKVASGQTVHAQKVDELMQEMAKQFIRQYQLDQPPPIPQ